jgi:hypothetical protein
MRSEINGLYSLFRENSRGSWQWWVCTLSLESDPVGQLLHLESHDQPTNCSPHYQLPLRLAHFIPSHVPG